MVSDNARRGMQQAPARSLFNALSEDTPLIFSISALVEFWLYATMDNTSSAACESVGFGLLSNIVQIYE